MALVQTDNEYDECLVMQAQQGNRNAAEVLVGGYFGFVCNRVKAYYFAGADHDDVVQEGLIGLYNAIKSYNPDKHASFRTFASLCISRRIISAVRYYSRLKHEPLNSYISLNMETDDTAKMSLFQTYPDELCSDPEAIVINRENLVGMECTINDTLSRFEYKVFLCYRDGMSYRQISRVVDRDEKSVDNAVQRIRKKLSTVL